MDWLTQFLSGLPTAQNFSGFVGPQGAPTNMAPAPAPAVSDQVVGAPREGSFDATPLGQALAGGTGNTGQGGDFSQRLLAGLRGVKAPPPRDVVKPSTPAAPRPMQIQQQSQLFNLLAALSRAPAQVRPQPTLGGSVGIGRY